MSIIVVIREEMGLQ